LEEGKAHREITNTNFPTLKHSKEKGGRGASFSYGGGGGGGGGDSRKW